MNVPDKSSQFIQALQEGKPQIIKKLLANRDFDSNWQIDDGSHTSALILAVKYKKVQNERDLTKKIKCLTILLEYGANVNDKDIHGMSASMYAANIGCVPVLQVLANFGADFWTVDNDGATAAMLAAQLGKCECLQFLLNEIFKSGIDKSVMNHVDKSGRTALMYAAIHGQAECLRRLVDFGVDLNVVDEQGYSALMHVLKRDEAACAQILLGQRGINIDTVSKNEQETALTLAFTARIKDYSIIEKLLHLGANLNESLQDYLHEMVARGKKKIVGMMVVKGCKPTDRKCSQPCFEFSYTSNLISPLAVALLSGYPDIARYFIVSRFLTEFDLTTLCIDEEILRKIREKNNDTLVNPLLNDLKSISVSVLKKSKSF